MNRALTIAAAIALGLAALAVRAQDETEPDAIPATATPDTTASARRLRSMPLERRQELATQIRRFRALSADEQARIRALDDAVRQADPEQRSRLQSIMRQYHLWIESLPDADRTRLRSLAPAERGVAVRALLKTHPLAPSGRLDDILAVSSNLSPDSILDQAWTLRVWFRLTPAERAEVQKRPDAAARRSALQAHAVRLELPQDRPAGIERLESEVRQRLDDRRRPGVEKALDAMKPQARKAAIARAVEARFFEGMRPAPVTRDRLDRFVPAMPDWVSETLDPLPPAAASRRLTLLYRLVFPSPAEIPATIGVRPGAPAPDGGTAAPAPSTPPPPAGASPF